MPKFVLAFRGGTPSSEEQGQEMMARWNQWMEETGEALVEPGAPFGKSRFLTEEACEGECQDALSGYSMVEAQDIDGAMEIARKNPIFSLGGTIEVAEALHMDEDAGTR